ncbi:hypothetical protein [Desulfatirhabdium butyrativorans]|uniref:hypothetical protein n=1 Tax=Desulfatirhabdium butyrativorans TaxID=340467 RepID=UPI000427577A|nr:hypothetical protein [Desulfatirhabdium butyrativorans]
MNDPELAHFTRDFLQEHGAVVVGETDPLHALLPDEISRDLDLPEEVILGETGFPLVYGSPVVDRMIRKATAILPLLCGVIDVPYVKKAGFETALMQDLSFVDAKIEIVTKAETRMHYLVVRFHYVALSDERKEGLITCSIQETSGALIDGFGQQIHLYACEHKVDANALGPVTARMAQWLQTGSNELRLMLDQELSAFIASMKHRLRRDVTNTREYYQALAAEMQDSLQTAQLSQAQREERERKIQMLPEELERKIADLKTKYGTRINVRPCAIERYQIPVAQLMLAAHHGKQKRTLSVHYNPITRRIDPLVCESCHQTARKLFLKAEKSGLSLVCGKCA